MEKHRQVLTSSILAIAFLFLGYFFIAFWHQWVFVLMPVLIGVLIVYLIYPLVYQLENRGMNRGRSVLVIYSMLILMMVGIGFFILPKIISNMSEMLQRIPELTNELYKRENMMLQGLLDGAWPKELKQTLQKEFGETSKILQQYILQFLKNSIEFLMFTPAMILNIILGLMIAYYFFRDTGKMKKRFLALLPRGIKQDAEICGKEIHTIMIHFIQGQLLTALIIALLQMLGLLILNVKYPFFLGMIGGICNVIPFFGPFISAIPAVVFAFSDSAMKAVWVVLLFAFIQQIDNLWISPKVIEGKLGLHPITTIIGVIAGGEFFGIWGMIVILPFLAMTKVLWKRAIDKVI